MTAPLDLAAELRRRAADAPAVDPDAEAGARDFTHDGLALDLGDRWKDDARHVAAWGRWMFWNGTVWRDDDRLEHMTRTRAFLRELAAGLPQTMDATARKLRRADTVAKVVGLARSNEAQAASVDQWDADPYAVGHPDPETP
jgi:putative DNA primase/helicase